jgi:hypothetical protein
MDLLHRRREQHANSDSLGGVLHVRRDLWIERPHHLI